MLKLSLSLCVLCSFLEGGAATRNLKISHILIHCKEATRFITFKRKTKNNNISRILEVMHIMDIIIIKL